jgi:hypothetical protein
MVEELQDWSEVKPSEAKRANMKRLETSMKMSKTQKPEYRKAKNPYSIFRKSD